MYALTALLLLLMTECQPTLAPERIAIPNPLGLGKPLNVAGKSLVLVPGGDLINPRIVRCALSDECIEGISLSYPRTIKYTDLLDAVTLRCRDVKLVSKSSWRARFESAPNRYLLSVIAEDRYGYPEISVSLLNPARSHLDQIRLEMQTLFDVAGLSTYWTLFHAEIIHGSIVLPNLAVFGKPLGEADLLLPDRKNDSLLFFPISLAIDTKDGIVEGMTVTYPEEVSFKTLVGVIDAQHHKWRKGHDAEAWGVAFWQNRDLRCTMLVSYGDSDAVGPDLLILWLDRDQVYQ